MTDAMTDAPPARWDEAERLAALRRYRILDTEPEPAFDDVTRIAALVLRAPIAVVNLVEDTRQFFKSEVGLGVRETALDVSICARAILQPGLFVVPDLREDDRFGCNPLVTGEPHLRFYAGALLETPEGLPIGTVCVLDTKPRPEGVTPEQAEVLASLARQTMLQLELRRTLALRDAEIERRARAEHESRLYRAAIEQSPDFIGIATPDGRLTYVNEAGRRIVGLGDEAQVRATNLVDCFAPEDRPAVPDAVAPTQEREGRWVGETRFRRLDAGGSVPAHVNRFVIRDEAGTRIGVAALARDITREREQRERLAESEATFRAITDCIDQMIWSTRPDGFHDYYNARWYEYTGVPEGSTDGEGWNGMFHPDDQEAAWGVWRHSLATGEPYHIEYRLRHRSGQYRWVLGRAQPVRDPATGAITRWFGTCTDIHDLKAMRDALAQSVERYRLAARATNDAIWDWDLASDGIVWNRAIERLFGHPDLETPSGWWKAQIHPEDRSRVVESITGVIEGGGTRWQDEYRFRRADGAYAYVLDRGYVLRDEAHRPVRMIGAILDLTERKRSEERQALIQRELHHRVKNTLATVQAIAGSTMRSAESMDAFRIAFTDRLISLGKTHTLITENAWEGASLAELLRLELDPYDDGTGGRVSLRGPTVDLPSDMAVALGMALHELTTNAVKYGALSVLGGCVEVTWSREPGPDGDRLRLVWTERNGPPVSPPTRRGFGSQLLQRALGAQLRGQVEIEYAPDGVRVVVEATLPGLPAAPEHI